MFKSLLALAALALAFAAPASADTRFEGNIKFTKKTTACNSSVKLGTVWRSRFHPGNTLLPGNNGWAGIGRTEDFLAQAWGRDGDFTTSFQKVSNGVLSHKFTGVIGDDISPSKSFLKLNALPPTLNGGTETVKLTGRIKNPFGTSTQTRCIVDFTAIYQNRDLAFP